MRKHRKVSVVIVVISLTVAIAMMVPVSYASGSAATVLFSDNFEEYAAGQQVIQNNLGTNTYPQWYQAGSASICGNSTWQSTNPPPPDYSWPLTCQSLNGESAQWNPPAAWDVSTGEAHSGTQSLYLQVGDAPDKVTVNFFVDPNSLHTGDYVSFETWVYLGPAFGDPNNPSAKFVFISPVGRFQYSGSIYTGGPSPPQGVWEYSTSDCPVNTLPLGTDYLTPGVWHDLKMAGIYPNQYLSLQIDGQTPFDATLKGQTVSCEPSTNQFGVWLLNPPGVCADHPPQPISGQCYGDWGDHANHWMYVDDFLATDVPQVTMTVSYSIQGGGSPSAPVFQYMEGETPQSYTLSSTPTEIQVDSGSSWSVTPNPLSGSSSSEQWDSNQALSGLASTTSIVFTFYHQYLQTLSYSLVGGGSPSAPSFTANQFGVSDSQALTLTAAGYWYDWGSPWSLTNPLGGSTGSEQWVTSQPTSGTIAGSQTLVFTYQNQYFLTMQVAPVGAGTTTPATGWQNAEAVVPLSETLAAGYAFSTWACSGAGCYSGTSTSPSITMNNPMAETANFIAQVTMTVSYQIFGGGTPTAPTLNYIEGGQSETYTLTTTPTPISVDAGSSWSVTPNPLSGSTSSEQWQSSETLSGITSTTTIVFTFYHQYLQTLSYSVVGSGAGYSAPALTANQFGSSNPQVLSATPTGYWYDSGSSWTITDPLTGSTSSEQWWTTQSATGTIASAQTVTFTYQHQYYLTMQTSPSSEGSVTPSSAWQNAGATPQIQATPNGGYYFSSWTGSSSGSYSGTSNPVTVTMNGPITETANFAQVATTLTTVTATSSITSSASSTSTFTTLAGSTLITVSGSPVITNTLYATTTTTGSVAGTSTTTFTSPLSTSYSTDTTSSVVSSSTSFTQTGATTTGTVQSETTTSTGTTLGTTTSGGTITVTETDTFNVLLTQLFQALEQFEAFVLQTLGFRVTATPVGQQVNQVMVTVTTPTTSTTSSTTVTSFITTTSSTSTTTSLLSTYTTTSTLPTTTLSPTVTKTISTTTTTTGTAAKTSTTTFTSILTTATGTSTTTISTRRTTMPTATTTTGTTTSTSTSSSTTLSTTTVSGTVTVSQTDTFTVFLTKIIQTLLKFANEVLKLLGTRRVVTPRGQKVIRVIVTKK